MRASAFIQRRKKSILHAFQFLARKCVQICFLQFSFLQKLFYHFIPAGWNWIRYTCAFAMQMKRKLRRRLHNFRFNTSTSGNGNSNEIISVLNFILTRFEWFREVKSLVKLKPFLSRSKTPLKLI